MTPQKEQHAMSKHYTEQDAADLGTMLEGATINGVDVDEDGTLALIVSVEREDSHTSMEISPDGNVKTYLRQELALIVSRDSEGNGPGFLHIEELQEETDGDGFTAEHPLTGEWLGSFQTAERAAQAVVDVINAFTPEEEAKYRATPEGAEVAARAAAREADSA